MDSTEKHLQILTNATGSNAELLNIKIPPGNGDIVVQLDLINEQDDVSLTSRQSSINSNNSINFNSPVDIFQTLLQRVTKTPNELKFLNILQHLLCIDPNREFCNDIWDVAEKLLHRITQVENSDDAQHLLLKTTENPKQLSEKCVDNKENENTKQQLKATTTTLPIPDLIALPSPSSVPLPPPPLTDSSCPSPPPPLSTISVPPPPPPLLAGGGPPPPPPLLTGGGPPPPPPLLSASGKLKQNIPKPTKKLKIFNWTKIPPLLANKSNTIWSKVATLDLNYKCNYQLIEELFYSQIFTKDEVDSGIRVDSNKPIQLLNSQFSLQINIFLSQFKGYKPDDIIQLIYSCNSKIIDLDKLKDLIKFLSKEDDLAILQLFDGDRQRLGNAEKFLISLVEIPNYKLRIDFMVFKENFNLNMNILESSVKSIFEAGKYLMESESLLEIFHIILNIGNYLNYGNSVGNATGITISSLNKISDTKANKPNMHLLHLLVMEIEKYDKQLVNFYQDFSFLAKVSRLNIIQIGTDIDDLKTALDTLIERLKSQTTNAKINEQELETLHNIMDEFLQEAENKLKNFRHEFDELKSLHRKMAEYFCENVDKSNLDEFFIIFHKFCEEFKKSFKESKEMQEREIREERKRKLKEEQLANKSGCHTFPMKSRGRLARRSLKDINTSLIQTEANNVRNIEKNSSKNENDLMAYLENSNYKPSQKKLDCIAKRASLKFSKYERERDLTPCSHLDINTRNHPANSQQIDKLPTTEGIGKQNVIQKSWKLLMEKYKASKCLTPDAIPPRQSLQILIRSNSTVDSKTGQLRKTASVVKITKTPLPQTQSVFNFQPSEIEEFQKTSNNINEIENKSMLKTPRRPLKLDISRIVNEDSIKSPLAQQTPVQMRNPKKLLCRRFSYINDKDLMETRKSLRTPTIEGTNMCFSPILQQPSINLLAFTPTLAKPKKFTEEQRTSADVTVNPNETIEVVKDELKVNITLGYKENDIQEHLIFGEQDVIEEQPEISELNNPQTNENILEDKISSKMEKLKSAVLSENLTPAKPSLSKRLVAKFQNKFKAFSRPSSVENLLDETRITEKFKRSRTITEPSVKPNLSQRIINRLRALSPLKVQSLDDVSLQSSISNFKQDSKGSNSSTKRINQPDPNRANEKSSPNDGNKKSFDNEMLNVKRRSSIEKEHLTKNKSSIKVINKNSPNKPNTSKLKSNDSQQQRVSLRSSITPIKRSTNSLNSLQSNRSKTSLKSNTECKQRTTSLQHSNNFISSNSSKIIQQRRSSLSNINNSKTSTYSSKNMSHKRSSLTSSKLCTEMMLTSSKVLNKSVPLVPPSQKDIKSYNSTKLKSGVSTNISQRRVSMPSSLLSTNSSKTTLARIETKRNSLKNPTLLKSTKTDSSKIAKNSTNIRKTPTNANMETKNHTSTLSSRSSLTTLKPLVNTRLTRRSSLPTTKLSITRNSTINAKSLNKMDSFSTTTKAVVKSSLTIAKTSSNPKMDSKDSRTTKSSLTNSPIRKANLTPSNSSVNSKRISTESFIRKPLSNNQQRRASVPTNSIRRTSLTSINSLKQNRNSTRMTSARTTDPDVTIPKTSSTSEEMILRKKVLSEMQ